MKGLSSWFKEVFVVARWLTPRRRKHLALLMGLSIVGALAELATLGAVVPFLMTIAEPSKVLAFPIAERMFIAMQWEEQPERIIRAMTALFVLTVLVAAALRLALNWATAKFSHALGHDLSVRLLDRVLHQPYTFHTSRNTSEVISGIGKADSVASGVILPLLDLIVATVLAIAIIFGLLIINWVAAVVAGSMFLAIYWFIGSLSRERLSHNSRIVSNSATIRVKGMQESLGGIRDVLLDGSQKLHLNRFQSADKNLRRALVQNSIWGNAPRYLVEALGMGVIAGIACSAGISSDGIGEALPILGALALGAQRLLPLFQRIYFGWTSVEGNRGALEDVSQLANAPILEGADLQGQATHLPFRKVLKLDGVGFRYNDTAAWVVRNVHLQIPKGARVGFTGETGSGKSTLLDLIMCLLSPTEGHLEVDEVRLTPANRQHWQARIAHVPQNIYLADASLLANIAFNEHPDQVDMSRAKQAAQRAKIDYFIESLSEGYNTMVGERGVRLSGGQRQRIGVARALYRKADVLILDEATSALDGKTESSVMDGIAELGAEITVLIIAHRLSTLKGCDFIVSLNSCGLSIRHPTEVLP